MKNIISMLVLLAWASMLPAQVTREQADSIVKEYLQGENIDYGLLYVSVNLPNAEEITITTSNEEVFTAKYACWAYYLKENELSQCRYFFVKEGNGNLLEVIANNDLKQSDSTKWIAVEEDDPVVLIERVENTSIRLYPNPVSNHLIIENEELIIENVDIYNMVGQLIQSEIVNLKSKIKIDISNLPAGVYLVKIKTKTGILTQKIVKYQK